MKLLKRLMFARVTINERLDLSRLIVSQLGRADRVGLHFAGYVQGGSHLIHADGV
jgi:hypothetical protein